MSRWRGLAHVAIYLFITVAFAGCGATGATIGRKVITTIDRAEVAAGQTWGEQARARDKAIVDEGIAHELPPMTIRAQLADWRSTVARVEAGFAALVKSLHVLRNAIDLAEAGVGKFSLLSALPAVAEALGAVLDGLKAAGVAKLPPEVQAAIDLLRQLGVLPPGGA